MANRAASKDQFLIEVAKKKPALQALIDNLDTFTEADIRDLPGQPLWVREALTIMKTRGPPVTQADIEANIRDARVGDPLGEVREWRGAPALLGTGLSGLWKVEIETGDWLFLLSQDKEIIQDSTLIQLTDAQWQQMLASSVFVTACSLVDYKAQIRQRLNTRHGH